MVVDELVILLTEVGVMTVTGSDRLRAWFPEKRIWALAVVVVAIAVFSTVGIIVVRTPWLLNAQSMPLWRLFGEGTAGHWLIVVGVLFLLLATRSIWPSLFLYGLHESAWYVTELVHLGNLTLDQTIVFDIDMAILILSAVAMITRFDAHQFKWFVLAGALIVAYDIVWLSAGFPISLDTRYYHSVLVNTVEVMSWLVPTFALLPVKLPEQQGG